MTEISSTTTSPRPPPKRPARSAESPGGLARRASVPAARQRGRRGRRFLVDEDEFDEIHRRIVDRGISHWADPARRLAQRVNTNDGGRGLYWLDPDGHVLDFLTVPYGGWSQGPSKEPDHPRPAGAARSGRRDGEKRCMGSGIDPAPEAP